MPTLTITNLSKTYSNGIKALHNVNLHLEVGMFGLLGPNGAGKSTLMRTIAGLHDVEAGAIYFDNIDVAKHAIELKKILGYLPQEFGVYPNLTPLMLLRHFAILKGITDNKQRKEIIDYLLEKVNLSHARSQKLGTFSGGMKQRFGIAQALLNNPKLLIVDEPTAGLDPSERNRFYNILSELSEDTIVILSTHIVEDVEQLCPKMGILIDGQLAISGDPREIKNSFEGMIYERTISKIERSKFSQQYNILNERMVSGVPSIRIISESPPGDDFILSNPTLEDVYLAYTNTYSNVNND